MSPSTLCDATTKILTSMRALYPNPVPISFLLSLFSFGEASLCISALSTLLQDAFIKETDFLFPADVDAGPSFILLEDL